MMNYRMLGLTVALLSVFSVIALGAETAPKKAAPKAPEGYVIVEEEDWLVLEDDLLRHFHQARESFLKKEMKVAASEIRKSGVFLKVEAAQATAESKKALLASAHELEKLASDVKAGAVKSAKDLDDAFVGVHLALARHHHEKAQAAQAKNEHKTIGHYLRAAAAHLEQALAWAGHKSEAAVISVIDGARVVGGKLIKGAGWTVDEVGKAIDALGKEIERLGMKIEPAKKK
jgi:hypothetical protein